MSDQTPIDELLQHSLDANTSISLLVRYSSILAGQINDAAMEKWCESELEGFKKLPDYRKVYGVLTGEDSYLRSMPIGFADTKEAEFLSKVQMNQPIGNLEEWVKNTKEGSALKIMFPAEFAQKLMDTNEDLTSVYWVVQLMAVRTIIQGVRNKIFQWAKTLKKDGVVVSGSFPKLFSNQANKSEGQTIINATTLNAATLGSGNNISQSPMQVSTVSSTQNSEYSKADLNHIKEKLNEFSWYLAKQNPSIEVDQLIDEIATYNDLVETPKPRYGWISESLSSIRGILENATGSAIATYADKAHLVDAIGKLIGF